MENSRNRGDSVCKEITEQIRSRINPNSRDLADLKAAADENHEEVYVWNVEYFKALCLFKWIEKVLFYPFIWIYILRQCCC